MNTIKLVKVEQKNTIIHKLLKIFVILNYLLIPVIPSYTTYRLLDISIVDENLRLAITISIYLAGMISLFHIIVSYRRNESNEKTY